MVNVLEEFTHNSIYLSCCWEDELGKDKQAFNDVLFSIRVSEIRPFTRVENSVLVSLGSKGTGMFPRDEKILSGSSSLKNSVSQSVSLQTHLLKSEPKPKLHLGQHWGPESP